MDRTRLFGLTLSLGIVFDPIGSAAAWACGCFAPSTPAQPVVQAGERIVFAQDGDRVVAHIQIQYEGPAEDFAWLIPVPEAPEVRVGSEELFAALEATTSPQFQLNQAGNGCFVSDSSSSGFGCSADDALSIAAPQSPRPNESPPQVLVEESSAGPYEYAVVRADAMAPMVTWLNDNRYFVPEGADGVLAPYIRTGAYFLALRLKSGESSGNLQPLVLDYPSDLPMIPIILTQLGAVPDMGVRVWVLGEHRAVPRNYFHVEVNEEYIDWFGGAQNYGEVVARAVDEAEGGHAFVTEYSGPTDLMAGRLDRPGRFGSRADLVASPTPGVLAGRLRNPDFPPNLVRAILERFFPYPESAGAAGVGPDAYYRDLNTYLPRFDPERPFDPSAITDEVWERIVEPVREAQALFTEHPRMTRLYTALDPKEMTEDPVFGFNPDLPEVPLLHQATLRVDCENQWMELSDGRRIKVDPEVAWAERNLDGIPRTARVEVLREEGSPEVVIDNGAVLRAAADDSLTEEGGGCRASLASAEGSRLFNLALMLGLVWWGSRRPLRRR